MTIPVRLRSALVCCLLAAGCAWNPVKKRPEVVLVSRAQEKELGDAEAKRVAEAMGLHDAPALDAYLSTVGQRLVEHAPGHDTYVFHVVDMEEPNAFALPGGHVYVSRGLLAIMLLQTAGNGDDPDTALGAFEEKAGGDLRSRAEHLKLGGLPAVRTTAVARTRDGPLALDLTWVAHANRVYRITGATPAGRATTYRPAFQEAASEGHGASRMAKTLGVNREVSAEFLHRATHCPPPQRPSDETSEMPRNQPIL